jgi:DNA-binding winged helix-turn-helix (wHTH) protein/Tol biopolymer transport system component
MSSDKSLNQQRFQIEDDFVLDPSNRLLLRGDTPVALSPKAFDALVYLVQNAGRLLTRDELIGALWPDSYVEEGNLSVHVFQVRRALGAGVDGKAYIQTVPKKGYRFNAQVTVLGQTLLEPASAMTDPTVVRSAFSEVGETTPDPVTVSKPFSPAEEPGRIRSYRLPLLAGGVICLAVLVAIALQIFSARQTMRKIGSVIRLTSFSPELSVSAAAISPDGKTLAYANPVGIFLEEIATKETHRIHALDSGLRFLDLSWFPDGSRLLVAGAEPDAVSPSIWIVPTKGTTEPERVGAFQRGVVSPDGSQIALVKENNSVKELLLLPTAGGQTRHLAATSAGEDLGRVFWSLDGRHIAFVIIRWDSQLRGNRGSIRSVDLSSRETKEIVSAANLSGDAISLPDARLVYGQLLGANPAGSYGTELREVALDTRTGHQVGDSVSLGRWTEELAGLSSSADGRRLVFRTVVRQHSVYAGDLDPLRESLSRVRRLTFGKGRDDFPRAWTPDSKAIFFDSNRNGKWEIFKQAADQIADEPYVQSTNDDFGPTLSPDGRALLYLDRPRVWREPEPVRLMRASLAERFPQFVLQMPGYSEWGLRFQCAQTRGGSCILAQRIGNEIVFRRFDAERGFDTAMSGVLKVQLDANLKISWALAPDGLRLAWIVSDAPEATIHLISLARPRADPSESPGRETELVLARLSHLHALTFSPDGRGWYVTTRLPTSWKIVYANDTHMQVLWQGWGEYSPEAWPSPDGRHLAFSEVEQDSNVWLSEGSNGTE